MNAVTPDLSPWRPLFWEPVAGTGERILVGVVYRFHDSWDAVRILRDDVLSALYGKAAIGARNLIDFALGLYCEAAKAGDSLEKLGVPIGGLHPGPLRSTEANSVSELLRIAALLHSSLAHIDKLDEPEESDQPATEEVARRFSSEIRDTVASERPDLLSYFGRGLLLVQGGESVRFGYASTKVLAHFNVISPMRYGAGLRDARARLFELQNGNRWAGIPSAALISGFPRDDDPTLGNKQRAKARELRVELEREASSAEVEFRPVYSTQEAAAALLDFERGPGRTALLS